jgi:hypothetical protein
MCLCACVSPSPICTSFRSAPGYLESREPLPEDPIGRLLCSTAVELHGDNTQASHLLLCQSYLALLQSKLRHASPSIASKDSPQAQPYAVAGCRPPGMCRAHAAQRTKHATFRLLCTHGWVPTAASASSVQVCTHTHIHAQPHAHTCTHTRTHTLWSALPALSLTC